MLSCQNVWFLLFIVTFVRNHPSTANPFNEVVKASKMIPPNVELITEDVIHDNVELDTKRVIRVNPLDLPPLNSDSSAPTMGSSLYKVQSLKPNNATRTYFNLQRSKPLNQVKIASSGLDDAPIIRSLSTLPSPDKTSKAKHQPKKKHLHFLYSQKDLTGNLWSKAMRVHVAAGAYPVYYVITKTNGRFGKHPLKSFSNAQAFMKYLHKNKLENLPILRTESEKV